MLVLSLKTVDSCWIPSRQSATVIGHRTSHNQQHHGQTRNFATMSATTVAPYTPKHKIRVVTAASLFDGHDAAINIMRRIIQSTGAEVIHLGHDRSVEDVVN